MHFLYVLCTILKYFLLGFTTSDIRAICP